MELKELIKNTVYENFINGSVNNLKIAPYFDLNGYSSVIFDFEGLHFFWSVNKNGYICQHEPFNSSNDNNLLFDKVETDNICEIVSKYVSEHEESNKEKINRIAVLQSEIEKLQSELI